MNIHYKTPVRYEIKDPISDAELIHRQEQAKKLYQEERRRKYLQELQDLNNRRHTDNFTPSQKSPISLHRYDDFGTIYDYATKSSNYPKTVARALYNFQGQTSRYLIVAIFVFSSFFHFKAKFRKEINTNSKTNNFLSHLYDARAESWVSKRVTSFSFDVRSITIGTRVKSMPQSACCLPIMLR